MNTKYTAIIATRHYHTINHLSCSDRKGGFLYDLRLTKRLLQRLSLTGGELGRRHTSGGVTLIPRESDDIVSAAGVTPPIVVSTPPDPCEGPAKPGISKDLWRLALGDISLPPASVLELLPTATVIFLYTKHLCHHVPMRSRDLVSSSLIFFSSFFLFLHLTVSHSNIAEALLFRGFSDKISFPRPQHDEPDHIFEDRQQGR